MIEIYFSFFNIITEMPQIYSKMAARSSPLAQVKPNTNLDKVFISFYFVLFAVAIILVIYVSNSISIVLNNGHHIEALKLPTVKDRVWGK